MINRLTINNPEQLNIMVDKERRAEAGKLIGDLFSGRITNFDYEERFPKSDSDPALHAIYTAVWFSYSDLRQYRLNPHKLTAEDKEILARILLFLHSNDEYTGPRQFIDLLAMPKRFWYWITRQPKPSVPDYWPFGSQSQFQKARLDQDSLR